MTMIKSDNAIWLWIMILAGAGISQGRMVPSIAPPAWQNPDIGLTLDGVMDAHDAETSWKSSGLTLRGAELIISANIDPYAVLLGNVLVSEDGAELHEAFAEFPFLPCNLKGKAGLMLANFGRWNRFHVHAMPFTSEPRIYKEYAGGLLALKGIELSWMVPINHFIEISLSVYDRIQGHSHDSDPTAGSIESQETIEAIAKEIGAEKHGGHWHGPDGEMLYEEELLELAGATPSLDAAMVTGNRRPAGFAYGGRITTTFEFGPQVSLDLGGSGIYQHIYRQTRRAELNGRTYSKLLYGADATLFWHPLTANKYRNLQIGAEMLGSYEGFERLSDGWLFEDYYNRLGLFSWLAWRQSELWQLGAFGEQFQSNNYRKIRKNRLGMFATLNITHYQYIRLEFSRYDYPGILAGVNRIMLQYDATIGYHTHGRNR